MSGNQWCNRSNVILNNDIITFYNWLIDYCLEKDIILLALLHFRGDIIIRLSADITFCMDVH